MGRAILAVVCVAMCACSTFSEVDDTDAGDAGAGAAETAGPDAGSFCATQPSATFCADFDGPGDVTAGWTSSELVAGGSVVKSAQSHGGASALAAHVEKSSAPLSAGRLVFKFPATVKRTRMSFDIRMNAEPVLPENGQLSIAEFFCSSNTDATKSDGAYLFYQPANGTLAFRLETAMRTTLTPVTRPTIGGWTHYEVDAQWENHLVYVRVDGIDPPTSAALSTSCSDYDNGRMNIGLSVFATATVDALYDNVVLEENPP